MAASFPSAVPTTANLRGDLIDNASTALSASLLAAATTINVDSTASFPTAGLLSLKQAAGGGIIEVCSYTGKTGTSFTGVTRNFNSLGNQAYSEDDEVHLYFVANHFNRVVEEIIAVAQNINDRLGLGATTITIPSGVQVVLAAGARIRFKSPDGTHTYDFGYDNDGNFGTQAET